MATKSHTALPTVVSQAEWLAAHEKLLAKEKCLTKEHDRLAAERRRMPMAKIDKPYVFEGEAGKVGLLDLFEGRRQLLRSRHLLRARLPRPTA